MALVLVDGLRQGDESPVVVTESFRTLAGGKPLPRLFRQTGGEPVGAQDAESGRDVV
jgi:hypothetical protein